MLKKYDIFISFNVRHIGNKIQSCAVRAKYGNNHLSVISIYCPPNILQSFHYSLFDNISGQTIIGWTSMATITCEDYNNIYKNNTTGSNIVDALNQTNLIVLNDGSTIKITLSEENFLSYEIKEKYFLFI